jgi:hypothetical protein
MVLHLAVKLPALHARCTLPSETFAGINLCYKLNRPQGRSAWKDSLNRKKSNNLIESLTGYLPDYCTVFQPTTLLHTANF